MVSYLPSPNTIEPPSISVSVSITPSLQVVWSVTPSLDAEVICTIVAVSGRNTGWMMISSPTRL